VWSSTVQNISAAGSAEFSVLPPRYPASSDGSRSHRVMVAIDRLAKSHGGLDEQLSAAAGF
jgi:hypothetical protein